MPTGLGKPQFEVMKLADHFNGELGQCTVANREFWQARIKLGRKWNLFSHDRAPFYPQSLPILLEA